MLTFIITLILLLCVIGILWWVITSLSLPQPIQIVAIAVIAIVAILILWSFLPGQGQGLHSPFKP